MVVNVSLDALLVTLQRGNLIVINNVLYGIRTQTLTPILPYLVLAVDGTRSSRGKDLRALTLLGLYMRCSVLVARLVLQTDFFFRRAPLWPGTTRYND